MDRRWLVFKGNVVVPSKFFEWFEVVVWNEGARWKRPRPQPANEKQPPPFVLHHHPDSM